MANYLLVHGAWGGAWYWRPVQHALIRAGHNAHAVTLTGLGERAHLLSSGITLETHIADVRGALAAEELADCILVVHSYAGMLGTAVADREPAGTLRHLVYVDAVVPRPGESWSSTHGRATAERAWPRPPPHRLGFPPPDPGVFGLQDADYEWVRRRQTPHPGHTYEAPLAFDPARVARVPRTFIDCTQPALATIDAIRPRVRDAGFWDGAWLPGSRVVELATGHDPMLSERAAMTRLLLELA
ncbi:MAG: alpha/beta hydrolase [Burkholderiaceae bacterium]|nr:alpha/beta hydrolase [Burkholderiaceae bacterium]